MIRAGDQKAPAHFQVPSSKSPESSSIANHLPANIYIDSEPQISLLHIWVNRYPLMRLRVCVCVSHEGIYLKSPLFTGVSLTIDWKSHGGITVPPACGQKISSAANPSLHRIEFAYTLKFFLEQYTNPSFSTSPLIEHEPQLIVFSFPTISHLLSKVL